MLASSIGALAYARRQHELMESAALEVAGRSLDSLNIASLRRRLNRSLMIQEAQNEAIIDGDDPNAFLGCHLRPLGVCLCRFYRHQEPIMVFNHLSQWKLKNSGGEGGIRTPGRVFDPTTV